MKIRVVHNQINNIRPLSRVYKDEWSWVFVCFDEYGEEHGVNHDSAVINFSLYGSSDKVLTKTAFIQGSRMTFDFESTDFQSANDYVYQVVVTENGETYTIAQGILYLNNKIE